MTEQSVAHKICAVEGCDNKKHAHIYCGKHYYKYKTYGDPLGGRRGASPGAPMKWIHENKDYAGDDCLKWPFEITRHGYGTIKQNGKKRVASRVMCEVAHGMPPDEKMEACHSCGNGHLACMNPGHLRWGTRKDNASDAKRHGTFQRGRLKTASISEEDARYAIRMRGKMTQAEIADKIGTTTATIAHIHCGATWARIADETGYVPEKMVLRGEQKRQSKVTEKDVRMIRELRGTKNQRELGEMFGIDRSQIGKIQRGEWWAWVK